MTFSTLLPLGMSATQPLSITNVGNAPASVTVEAADPGFGFSFAPTGAQTIAPAGSLAGTVTFVSSATALVQDGIKLTTTGATCAAPPTVVASGTGIAHGLAVQAVPAADRGRANGSRGAGTLCVRTSTGVVACTGRNTYGMRGASDAFIASLTGFVFGGGGGAPAGVSEFGTFNVVQTETGVLSDVVDLIGGRGYFCARRTMGDLWCWGAYDGTGNNTSTHANQPFASHIVDGVTAAAAGYSNLCVIRGSAGTLQCRSKDTGNGASFSRTSWTMTGATKVAVSGGAGYGLLTDGTVKSFGKNRNGERGDDSADNDPAAAVTGLTGITQITAGGGTSPTRGQRFGCALKDDLTVWCWGANRHGQLGNGTSNSRDNQVQDPVLVQDTTQAPLAGVTAIAAGQSHACALIGGAVSCWGRGDEGEIGSGNTNREVSRAEATNPALTNAVSLGLGSRASCAVLATGAVACWGQIGPQNQIGPTPLAAFEP